MHYHKLIAELQKRMKDTKIICEQLPTNNNVIPPNKHIEDDVAFIRDIVTKEVADGMQVTVIGHSWGGMIASAALADFAVPNSNGSKAGGVADIVLMCAFIPSEEDSLAGMFGGQLPPFLTSLPDPDNIIIWEDPIGHLYNDLPTEEAQWAERLMVAHGHQAQYTPITSCCQKAAWRVIPMTYIICENDQALPSFLQEMMVNKIESQGVRVKRYSLPSSHSPFLSMPERVAEIVAGVMRSRLNV